ncbi:hypothetical protein BGZ65_005882 [Modicella reniformis]|uniref:Metallo-beta-lactamase domain-containing protein n=1 Tax=Modicella reniformis TaxID=1440133 RepID=A0A9P6LTW5_9FUNG|nr:hypothetical protein BGZ65_005882 [Modicella reniformis]
METLEKLPNIARLSERVVRILGLNPGKFTLQGTNTYLIGKGSRKVLLDTGEGNPDYIPLLQTALDQDLKGATISRVICSHWHHDHVGGIQDVLRFLAARNIHLSQQVQQPPGDTLPGIYKFPDQEHDDSETPFQRINDQEEIQVDEQTTLITLHTPGHTADHCSFYLKEENTLFTADCVLGQGTAVFEDLSSYIKSLERQLTIGSSSSSSSSFGTGQLQPSYKIYPGHGPVIEDGPTKIREYIKHRLDREKQILAVLIGGSSSSSSSSPSSNNNNINSNSNNAAGLPIIAGKTAMQIVTVIYAGYPSSLYPAAEHQVLLHLKKLEQDGKVKRGPAELISDAVWESVQGSAQASL